MHPTRVTWLAVIAVASPAFAKTPSDLSAASTRANTIARSYALVHRVPLPLPEVASPFNPAAFDTEEKKTPVPHAAPAPSTDREILETAARRLPIGGTTELRGRLFLNLGSKRAIVGEFIVSRHDNRDVELEVVALTPNTVTFRYRGEEFVRAIPH